ncbi:hypothetical protein QAD02_022394 [Eretmocerus hayati]|uniref:Uncharacterized protein n=1 Tax=Eretmocerus hayati TaxID=131215 RepID=A0ACC2PT53_9HYME|nr:hypothetical protein QAD02_022394 [Eretmocerus hayati]
MLRTLVIVVALVALVASEKATFDNYKVFRITPSSAHHFTALNQLQSFNRGYEFWTDPSRISEPVDIMVAPAQFSEFSELMNSTQMNYEVLVENVQKLIDEENPQIETSEFGWKKYYTLEQIYDWLESLQKKYPGKVEVVIGGSTYEGRDIKGIKISFGPEEKPGVFIEGGIHAREWIAPATATWLINEFLTSEDPVIRDFAESYDWYIFPVVNPDGYSFTHTGNRLWRKTRSKGILFCNGADANRNWDYKWMQGGASPIPCFDNYAGKKAFSEIETKSLSKYLTSIKDKLFAYIAFHSYSQLLMFPYGDTKEHLDNYDESKTMGVKAIEALAKRYGTEYKTGNIAETIYVATGSSIDWVKANLKLPVTFIYELRDKGRRGFLLPADQIIPNSEEVLDSLVAMFLQANEYGYPEHK